MQKERKPYSQKFGPGDFYWTAGLKKSIVGSSYGIINFFNKETQDSDHMGPLRAKALVRWLIKFINWEYSRQGIGVRCKLLEVPVADDKEK